MAGHGQIRLPVNDSQYFVLSGGPYRQCPENMRGVKMAMEIKQDCVVDIPTKDYHVPDRLLMYRGMHKALDLILAGEPLYVGCMGGVGRTGLFLSCMAKAFGVKNPVAYVREHYNGHAVETEDQMKFVKRFTITPPMKRKLKLLRRRQRWYFWTEAFWKTNLTRMPVEPIKEADIRP
jgi:hypothetical protein